MKPEIIETLRDDVAKLDYFYGVVKKFHQACGHPDGRYTVFLTGEEKKRRIDWMMEEIKEFSEAKTLVDQADALGDLLWFVVGTMVCMGVEPSVIMRPITTANMSKIGDDGRVLRRPSDGKIQKPEGWVGPEEEMSAMIGKKYGVDANQIMIEFDKK